MSSYLKEQSIEIINFKIVLDKILIDSYIRGRYTLNKSKLCRKLTE